jgi:tryptophan synthase beta chain
MAERLKIEVPSSWYNAIADLPFDLPPNIPQVKPHTGPTRDGVGRPGGLKLQLPLALVRQMSSRRDRHTAISAPIRACNQSWRPTPFVRACRLERQIGTRARLYDKYEGGAEAPEDALVRIERPRDRGA